MWAYLETTTIPKERGPWRVLRIPRANQPQATKDSYCTSADQLNKGDFFQSPSRVAILYKNGIKVTGQSSKRFKTFESTECTYKSTTGEILRVVSIYRSGTATSQCAKIPQFLEDFEQLLSDLVDKPGKPLIMGDFNIHVEDVSDSLALRFGTLLKANGWIQQI